MSTQELQRNLWSIAPQYWSRYAEPFFLPLYKKVIEQLRLDEDFLVLDAGCGSGLFVHMASSTGAQVIGLDTAPGLLEVARGRSPQNNFLKENLQSLPFAAESFHVVTGLNSFQYADNVTAAMTEAKRVLKEGGRLVIAIWDKPGMSDATNILKAIDDLVPSPPSDTTGPFALSGEDRVEELFLSLELKMIYKTRVSCPALYNTLSDGIRSFLGTEASAKAIKYVPEKVLHRTIATALRPYQLTENFYHLQNNFLLFIAEK